MKYLWGAKAVLPFSIIVVAFVFLGSLLKVELVWNLSDLFNGLMVIPNLIALLALSGVVAKAAAEFRKNRSTKAPGSVNGPGAKFRLAVLLFHAVVWQEN